MPDDATIVIRFKDVLEGEEFREELEQRCRRLAAEFPESVRYEITLSPSSLQTSAHAHVTGKDTDVAAHATAGDPRQAGDRVLDKLERELRREHDKRIFSHRREAQRAIGKRTS